MFTVFMNFVEPIRDRKKIAQIKNQLRGQLRYRDLLLFVVGINTALRISDLLALRVAHFRARSGHKSEAIYLKEKFPMMRRYRFLYFKLGFEIRISRWLPYWVRFKCFIASRIKSCKSN